MEEDNQNIGIPQAFPSMGHTSEGALQYHLEADKIADCIIKDFQGFVQVRGTDGLPMWKQMREPMINDLGLNVIRSHLLLFLNGQKVFALSDLSEEMIADEVISINMDFIRDFEDNYIHYGIRNSTDASHIIRKITALTNAVLRKGEAANYLKFLRTTQNISEVQHHQDVRQSMGRSMDDSKQNIIGMLFGKKRR